MNIRAPLSAALLLTLACAFPAAAQTAAATGTQPVTHEALWLMKRVGAPVLSPDGKWVVTSVAEPSYDEKKESADLWLVPADGSAPPQVLTRLFGGQGTLNVPSWSPDGTRIAFVSYRLKR